MVLLKNTINFFPEMHYFHLKMQLVAALCMSRPARGAYSAPQTL